MDVLILLALILLNGVFAMSEIALVSARKSRLQKLADKGDRSAASAIALGEEPTRFMSTVQIGITAIGLLNGIYGEAALAAPFAEYLKQWGMSASSASITSTLVVVLGITYLSIVVGELVPKRLAQLSPEIFARIVARPLTILAILTRPFVSLLALSTDLLLKLLGKSGDTQEASVTEEDIYALVDEGSRSGAIEASERDLVRNVFRLDDRKVGSLMTPRSEMVAFDLSQAFDDNLNRLLSLHHERFPVIDGDIDNPIGVISAKQLLMLQLGQRSGINDSRCECLRSILQAPVFISEASSGNQLLEFFRHSSEHMVFVVDEYGDLQGLVTHSDLLEALTGEFLSKASSELWSIQSSPGSWLMNAAIPVVIMKDQLELDALPDEQEQGYQSLGGMLMWCLGEMPEVGDYYDWEQWRFTVLSASGNRLEQIAITRLPSEPKS
ncbi:hemolysin family protein [Ferrimonas aestuarii]|uniref:HlyC/CorC family transporter n=1 Tax=Ferrimonas aestuarii TaxID=2569539 RepID=A0A4U1BRT0_9GAMM|nr:hemolysin family protein [Ferrimonas aestuarii]TKB54549.1 HlyC/CorC family transporter [Ferrimonas aestuarii]